MGDRLPVVVRTWIWIAVAIAAGAITGVVSARPDRALATTQAPTPATPFSAMR